MSKSDIGKWGEIYSARFLREKGLNIVQSNYRTRFGEIDIIANDGKYIVFVEVKSRTNFSKGSPKVYVDERKQRKIILSAALYCNNMTERLQPRFDVIEVYFEKTSDTKPFKIKHIKNAFDAGALGVNLDFGG